MCSLYLTLTGYRLLPSPKVRTSSSATNFANLLRSTVRCATTKTKLVKTVAKSVTASTTAQSSATSPPTSSVASVAMPATWLATVPTANAAPTGATMTVVEELGLAITSTASTNPSWLNSVVAPLRPLVDLVLSTALRQALVATTTRVIGT